MKAIIYFPNDPSVGWSPETFEMEIPFNKSEYVTDYGKEVLREEIQNLYIQMHQDGNCRVSFDFENIND